MPGNRPNLRKLPGQIRGIAAELPPEHWPQLSDAHRLVSTHIRRAVYPEQESEASKLALAVAERLKLSRDPQLLIAALTYPLGITSPKWSGDWQRAHNILMHWHRLNSFSPGSQAHVNAVIEAVRNEPAAVTLHLADALTYFKLYAEKELSGRDRKGIARKLLEVYAPMADAAGLPRMCLELQDLGLRYARPARYAEVRSKFQELREKGRRLRWDVESHIANLLKARGINAAIARGPQKSYLRLWKKLLRGETPYDITRFRVLVEEPATAPPRAKSPRFRAFTNTVYKMFPGLKRLGEIKPEKEPRPYRQTRDAVNAIIISFASRGIQLKKKEDFFETQDPKKPGYRAVHLKFADPNGVPFSVHVLPNGMDEFLEKRYPHYKYAYGGVRGFARLAPALQEIHANRQAFKPTNGVQNA